MESFGRRRWRLVSAQEVSCCVYEMPKMIETVHEGQYPNLFVNWADMSLHFLLAVALISEIMSRDLQQLIKVIYFRVELLLFTEMRLWHRLHNIRNVFQSSKCVLGPKHFAQNNGIVTAGFGPDRWKSHNVFVFPVNWRYYIDD